MGRVNTDDIITNVKSCDIRIKNGAATTSVKKTGQTSGEKKRAEDGDIYQENYNKLQNRYDDVGYVYQTDKDKRSDILPDGCEVLYHVNVIDSNIFIFLQFIDHSINLIHSKAIIFMVIPTTISVREIWFWFIFIKVWN